MAVSASGASSAPFASFVKYVPLCLARYRPRRIIEHNVTKTTTATIPPIRAWSGPVCPAKAFGSLMLVAVADVVVLAVKATLVVTVAVVREGMTVVGSKVLKTSGEWKKKYKIKSYHANKGET